MNMSCRISNFQQWSERWKSFVVFLIRCSDLERMTTGISLYFMLLFIHCFSFNYICCHSDVRVGCLVTNFIKKSDWCWLFSLMCENNIYLAFYLSISIVVFKVYLHTIQYPAVFYTASHLKKKQLCRVSSLASNVWSCYNLRPGSVYIIRIFTHLFPFNLFDIIP